jgi:hypothetical protein
MDIPYTILVVSVFSISVGGTMSSNAAPSWVEQLDLSNVKSELRRIADEPVKSHLGGVEEALPSSLPSVDDYRTRVEAQLTIIEERFDKELERTGYYKILNFAALTVSVVLVLLGASIAFFYPDKHLGVIGGSLTAGGGLLGTLAWVMSFISTSQKRDIGLALTVARYRAQLAACDKIPCIQGVADEIAKVLAALN